jgi:hypothetical protein
MVCGSNALIASAIIGKSYSIYSPLFSEACDASGSSGAALVSSQRLQDSAETVRSQAQNEEP